MIVLLALLAAMQPSGDGRWRGFGPANFSCGTWTAHREADRFDRTNDIAWVSGFLSGINATNGGYATGNIDVNGAMAWIDRECAARPLDQVGLIASELAAEILRRAGRL